MFELQIEIDERLLAKRAELRRQKRESEARRREMRREQIPMLRVMFSDLLTEYGTFGKHLELIKAVRQRANARAGR